MQFYKYVAVFVNFRLFALEICNFLCEDLPNTTIKFFRANFK